MGPAARCASSGGSASPAMRIRRSASAGRAGAARGCGGPPGTVSSVPLAASESTESSPFRSGESAIADAIGASGGFARHGHANDMLACPFGGKVLM